MTCLIKNDRMLFQYRVAPQYKKLWDGFFETIDETGACSLYRFFDLNSATGQWLDYLGLIFNQGRTFPAYGDIFTWDSDFWDIGQVWDGEKAPLDDITYRALIWSRIARNHTNGTINDIIGVLQSVINFNNIIIVQGVKHLDITLHFATSDDLEIFNSLSAYDVNWFGVPAGVSFSIVKVL